MRCDKCLKKGCCVHIHHFNHDPSVGCIEFISTESPTYISTTTLNNEDYIALYRGIPVYDSLKALEIIKEKTDIGIVILGDKPKIRITYDGQLRFYDISQEEYDLLKEVLS